MVSRRKLEAASRVEQDLPFALFRPLLSPAAVAAAATAAATAELVTCAPAELPGCGLCGGLSECEEGAARNEISIVT